MYDFGYGDSFGIREALNEQIFKAENLIQQAKPYLGYPSQITNAPLESKILNLVKNSTGETYKYCILVSGAHMGIAACLKALEVDYGNKVHYDELHFLKYPELVRSLNFTSIPYRECDQKSSILLTASPSNPEGVICMNSGSKNTIWDAAYHNEIYTSPITCQQISKPTHSLMVGSAGKLTGMNGMRFGWVCTNDSILAERVSTAHYELTLGVNTISLALMHDFLDKVDLNKFYWRAFSVLCDNKSELSKLEYLFHRKIPVYGMFWFTEADSSARKLLAKCGVTYTEGVLCGGSKDTIRITLGQTRDITKKMVTSILKEDGK